MLRKRFWIFSQLTSGTSIANRKFYSRRGVTDYLSADSSPAVAQSKWNTPCSIKSSAIPMLDKDRHISRFMLDLLPILLFANPPPFWYKKRFAKQHLNNYTICGNLAKIAPRQWPVTAVLVVTGHLWPGNLKNRPRSPHPRIVRGYRNSLTSISSK